MKRIVVKYVIEVPENHIDKVCRKARCGKRELENDIKEMAEVSGRYRVYDFIQPYVLDDSLYTTLHRSKKGES
jgi:hypothetical protein